MKEKLIEVLKTKYKDNKSFATFHHTNYELFFDHVSDATNVIQDLNVFVGLELVKGLSLFAFKDNNKVSFFVDLGHVDGL